MREIKVLLIISLALSLSDCISREEINDAVNFI